MPSEIQKPLPQPTSQMDDQSQSQNTEKNSQSTTRVLSKPLPLPELMYLATPYSDPNPRTRAKRFSLALDASAILMKRKGIMVYSPIVQCHLIALNHALPTDSAFWESRDRRMIQACDVFTVLICDGWKQSVGVKAEYEYARSIGRPIWMVSPKDLGLDEENYK